MLAGPYSTVRVPEGGSNPPGTTPPEKNNLIRVLPGKKRFSRKAIENILSHFHEFLQQKAPFLKEDRVTVEQAVATMVEPENTLPNHPFIPKIFAKFWPEKEPSNEPPYPLDRGTVDGSSGDGGDTQPHTGAGDDGDRSAAAGLPALFFSKLGDEILQTLRWEWLIPGRGGDGCVPSARNFGP